MKNNELLETALISRVRPLGRMDQLLGLGDGLSASQLVTATRSASTNIEGVRATIIPRKKACTVDIAATLPVLLPVEICFLDKKCTACRALTISVHALVTSGHYSFVPGP